MRLCRLITLVTLCFVSSLCIASQQADPKLRQRLIEAIETTDSFEDRFEAEVWLMDMSNRLEKRLPDNEERFKILRTVHREASRADLPPELVLAVIDIEGEGSAEPIRRFGANDYEVFEEE